VTSGQSWAVHLLLGILTKRLNNRRPGIYGSNNPELFMFNHILCMSQLESFPYAD
jgi:hypothetical protein